MGCPLAWNYRVAQDLQAGFDASIFDEHAGPLVLEGYWQSFKYFERHRELICREFSLRDAPDPRNQEMAARIRKVEAVAIHIRRGDYVMDATANAVHGTCDLQYYQRAVEVMVRKVKNPHFFVFTDDPVWAKSNLTLCGPLEVVDHNLGERDHLDLWLMSQCRHFIIANSSFSWWGAWLGQRKQKTVIAPKRWFKIDKYPAEDRIPPEWIRL